MFDAGERLKTARVNAGYASAQDACDAFGFKYPTYIGHENGHRGITTKAAQRYAQAYRVDSAWLLMGVSRGKQSPPHQGASIEFAQESSAPQGFGEQRVTPFVAKTDTAEAAITRFAKAIEPNLQSMYLYRIKADHLDLGLLTDDVLIADHKNPPSDGQIVIISMIDFENNETSTILRRWHGGLSIPSITEPSDIPGEPTVRGVVVGTYRGTSI
ncbi:helix-turn-helix domain-containing protein [Yoonia sp. 208BN28-4]|uniref:helix-turn-helix domain-containing protein n=1 Tax=Yoonia sp. 208BN28-4 TaxID=3126505 RepID=UPI0030A58405